MTAIVRMVKILGIVLFCCYLIAGKAAINKKTVNKYLWEERYTTVPVDHFNDVSSTTFIIRYLVNDTFFGKDQSSPILFHCGHEDDIEHIAVTTGFIWENAELLNGLIIFAEHRYYGKSLPFGNSTFDSPQYFGFLTVEQVLADYAQLIDELTGGRNDRPVIAIGGSYGGMLAAWLRLKYPHYVTGALAASAPIFYFDGLVACNTFTKTVTNVFNASGPNCSDNISKAWKVLVKYARNETGRAFLNSLFNFCSSGLLKEPSHIYDFLDYIEDIYGKLAVVNYPYANDFLVPLPANPVREFCSFLSKSYDKDNELLEALRNALNLYTNSDGSETCLNYVPNGDDRTTSGWDIQLCNEISTPMCSNGVDNMFRRQTWNYTYYSDDCYDQFKVRPEQDEIRIRYGGRNIQAYSNIIFSNGLLDPWSGGGVLKTTNERITVIIIPEGAHHLDLRASNPKDPKSVVEARKLELKIIQGWIANFRLE